MVSQTLVLDLSVVPTHTHFSYAKVKIKVYAMVIAFAEVAGFVVVVKQAPRNQGPRIPQGIGRRGIPSLASLSARRCLHFGRLGYTILEEGFGGELASTEMGEREGGEYS